MLNKLDHPLLSNLKLVGFISFNISDQPNERLEIMAARTYNIATLCLPREMCKAEKNEMATKLGFYRSRRVAMITSKNGKFSVRASAGGTPRSVETINGKVNGIHVGEGTLFGNKKGTELIKDSDIDAPAHSSLHGNFVEGRFVYRQTFVIRSYEIGPDKTATMETLMNLLQVLFFSFFTLLCLCLRGIALCNFCLL